jgi:hypothetical protein
MNNIFNLRNLVLLNLLASNALMSCQERSISLGTDIKTFEFTDILRTKRCSINIEKEVFLETDVRGLISYPTKIIDYKGLLFLLTNMNNGTIVIFNKSNGKFVRKINHVGKGPHEYNRIKDFIIDKQKDRILILDENECILIYSFDDVFVSIIKLKDMQTTELRHIALADNKILIEGMDKDYNSMLIFNNHGNLIGTQFKAPFITAFLPSPLTYFGDNLYFHNKVCDTIFYWKDGKFRPYVFVNFGRYQTSLADVYKFQKEHPGQLSNILPKPRYSMTTFYETSDFYYFNLMASNMEISKSNNFHCFVRKQDNLPMCIEHFDLFQGILWHGNQFVGISEDLKCLISYIIPVELYEYRDQILAKYGETVLNNEYEELIQLCNATCVDDNPIILFLNLKNN